MSKTEAQGPKRAGPRARNKPAKMDWKAPDWVAVADELAPYAKLYEKWRTKAIDDEAYFRARGCFSGCDLKHTANGGDHYKGKDRTPPLLVSYLNRTPIQTPTGTRFRETGANHRRHDGNRDAPYYIFMSGDGTVRVTDPFDKFRYIGNARTNPEVWKVAFEGAN